MLIYNYDKYTREFTFSSEAEKNPEESYKAEKFVPLVPACATLKVPPKTREGYTFIFNDTDWEYIEDHRGEKVINPDTEEIVIVSYLGPLKDGYRDYSEYISSEEYRKKQEEKEKERIANLTCTKRVLALMLQKLGIDYYDDLKPAIEADKDARLEWDLCGELLRSNPLLDVFGKKFGITPKQLNLLFLYANGEITEEEFKAGGH